MRGGRRGVRVGAVLAAIVLLGVAWVVTWRVLGPAEVLAPAVDAYPVAAVRPPGVTGKTSGAPLIVEGRIRVFAAKRQIRADAPVDAKTSYTPRWSYRRWPEQLNGVVAIGATVITRWSDGQLVALDGRTGTIAWRAAGPSAGGYLGHRTGAETVWAPPGLHTSGTTVLVTSGARAAGYDAATGIRRWEVAVPRGCHGFTAGGSFACGAAVFDALTGATVSSWPAGPWTPLGCDVAGSDCTGLRDAAGYGWLISGLQLRRASTLDPPGAVPSGSVVLNVSSGLVIARRPAEGTELWRWPGIAQVLGSSDTAAYLLTSDRRLVALDLGTGAVRSEFTLAVGTEAATWAPGRWQLDDGYVAIERLTGEGPPDADAPNHYLTTETVILAALE